jgi:hypothetical protein
MALLEGRLAPGETRSHPTDGIEEHLISHRILRRSSILVAPLGRSLCPLRHVPAVIATERMCTQARGKLGVSVKLAAQSRVGQELASWSAGALMTTNSAQAQGTRQGAQAEMETLHDGGGSVGWEEQAD